MKLEKLKKVLKKFKDVIPSYSMLNCPKYPNFKNRIDFNLNFSHLYLMRDFNSQLEVYTIILSIIESNIPYYFM